MSLISNFPSPTYPINAIPVTNDATVKEVFHLAETSLRSTKKNTVEASITAVANQKEKLAKKYKPAMKSFKDQYGDEGESIYYATMTKKAKEGEKA